ncbi:hypothetical protein LCGC14_2286040 [marine sediment metagenome]|uniref:Uncharacterized protein n=1 Tax=marine sediment metagenome TaxID=412755 RepID=A0A0F9F585_9ZZZZ
MSGIKVTLYRMDNDEISPIIRTFYKGGVWEYTKVGETRTLLILTKGRDFLAEFVADAVESVEFV